MSESKILLCNCVHTYQDNIYGPKKRLHTYSTKKKLWRCTVCLKEKQE